MSIDDDRDHCCTPPSERRRAQPPGLTSLHTRPGTWAEFRARMVAGLTTQTVTLEGETEVHRPLRGLTTRQSDDGTIALLDAWAATCDVLAFYDERILEEGFLGTAKQRRSLVELAHSLGYLPSPGVAASVRLAFEIQDTPLTAGPITLDPGIAVISVPPEGELPQTFETVERIEARAAYNRIPARQRIPHRIENGVDEVWLAGIATRLEPGHSIVVADPRRRLNVSRASHAARVTAVDVDSVGQRTRVRFAPPVTGFSASSETTAPLVIAFRQRAGIFGHNAPAFGVVGQATRDGVLISGGMTPAQARTRSIAAGWPEFSVGAPDEEAAESSVHLEREVDGIGVDTWVYLEDAETRTLGKVENVGVRGRSDWTLTARVTTVDFDTPQQMLWFDRRGTTVHFASEELQVAEAPDPTPISGLGFDLDREVEPMDVGRAVIVEGETLAGEPYVLETTVAMWSGDRVTLRDPIEPLLRRSTVRLLGNVALATHGQTVPTTVIGNGDATAMHQRFSLPRGPLTWINTSDGTEAALELRIDGVLWTRVESLYYAGADDRVYVIETAEDGSAEVVLGDGVRGARAPTGVDNVTAATRIGLGIAGELDDGRLTLLQSRPQGLFAVRNPAAARGAADPESMDDVRTHAPLHVLTLDRLVSLSDYEDYARAYPGIGKARATELWDWRRAFVHVTVAAASGETLSTTDAVVQTLRASVDAAKDPTHIVVWDGHVEVRFDVHARLRVDEAYVRSDVEGRVRAALVRAYAFERRGFGQPVPASEVAAIIQGVNGVVGVDVDSVHAFGTAPAPLRPVLRAALPTWTGASVSRAELLLVREAGITLTEMTE